MSTALHINENQDLSVPRHVADTVITILVNYVIKATLVPVNKAGPQQGSQHLLSNSYKPALGFGLDQPDTGS